MIDKMIHLDEPKIDCNYIVIYCNRLQHFYVPQVCFGFVFSWWKWCVCQLKCGIACYCGIRAPRKKNPFGIIIIIHFYNDQFLFFLGRCCCLPNIHRRLWLAVIFWCRQLIRTRQIQMSVRNFVEFIFFSSSSLQWSNVERYMFSLTFISHATVRVQQVKFDWTRISLRSIRTSGKRERGSENAKWFENIQIVYADFNVITAW